jgi:hypothetical protein
VYTCFFEIAGSLGILRDIDDFPLKGTLDAWDDRDFPEEVADFAQLES